MRNLIYTVSFLIAFGCATQPPKPNKNNTDLIEKIKDALIRQDFTSVDIFTNQLEAADEDLVAYNILSAKGNLVETYFPKNILVSYIQELKGISDHIERSCEYRNIPENHFVAKLSRLKNCITAVKPSMKFTNYTSYLHFYYEIDDPICPKTVKTMECTPLGAYKKIEQKDNNDFEEFSDAFAVSAKLFHLAQIDKIQQQVQKRISEEALSPENIKLATQEIEKQKVLKEHQTLIDKKWLASKCRTLSSFVITQKLGPNTYEIADIREGPVHYVGVTSILNTTVSKFESAGIAFDVQVTHGGEKQIKLKNGFDKKAVIFNESQKCKKIRNEYLVVK